MVFTVAVEQEWMKEWFKFVLFLFFDFFFVAVVVEY